MRSVSVIRRISRNLIAQFVFLFINYKWDRAYENSQWPFFRVQSKFTRINIKVLFGPIQFRTVYFPVSYLNNKFWEQLIIYVPLMRRGPHRKLRLQRFFYCCVCIRCPGNGFTEPIPSNDRGISKRRSRNHCADRKTCCRAHCASKAEYEYGHSIRNNTGIWNGWSLASIVE
jgi:hypothetical protein